MKIKTLIKADFFANPQEYIEDYSNGYNNLSEIWHQAIKPEIPYMESTKRIDNTGIIKFIKAYRDYLKVTVNDYLMNT